MRVFKMMNRMDHEQIVFCHDREIGLRAIIAIHDTTLGPALGGCRMWNYHDEDEALTDVLRLSRGMTYKAAMAGLPLGGGKAVIVADPQTDKNEQLFRRFGKFVNSLGGNYITAQDVSITSADLLHMRAETANVAGLPLSAKGSGDPSPMTAVGVFSGIKACVKHLYGRDDLKGIKVAVQGCGSVGENLCRLLHEQGALLWVNDIDVKKTEPMVSKYGAKALSGEEIMTADVDVFSPCALGGILDETSIPRLKAKIVAGGANNQLAIETEHGEMLRKKGVLYAPDYVINAGGLISVSYELERCKFSIGVQEKTESIYDTLLEIFHTAESNNESTHKTSDRLAEERIARHNRPTEDRTG